MFFVHFCALDPFNGNLLRHGVGAGLKSAPYSAKTTESGTLPARGQESAAYPVPPAILTSSPTQRQASQ